jgi:hypothetical protein
LQLIEGDLYNYESVKEAVSGWYVTSNLPLLFFFLRFLGDGDKY